MSGFLPKAYLQVMFSYFCMHNQKMQEMCCYIMIRASVVHSVGLHRSGISLKVLWGSHKHPNSFFGRSPDSMKIIPLNEPEQTQLIKHNFDNEHHYFTFKYLPKWWQFINVGLKGSIHYSLSVKRQLMSDACTWTSF